MKVIVLMWEEEVVWSVFVRVLFGLVFGLFVKVEVEVQMIEQKIEGEWRWKEWVSYVWRERLAF